jgi:hypothetical protein
MIATNIEWHKPTEKLPEKSCYVFVHTAGHTARVHYSSEHKQFNAYDNAPPYYAFEGVLYWAYIPEFPFYKSEDE